MKCKFCKDKVNEEDYYMQGDNIFCEDDCLKAYHKKQEKINFINHDDSFWKSKSCFNIYLKEKEVLDVCEICGMGENIKPYSILGFVVICVLCHQTIQKRKNNWLTRNYRWGRE